MHEWVMCKTCIINLQEEYIKNAICSGCHVKNKDTYLCCWKNNKITKMISDMFKIRNVNLLDDELIYNELLKSGVLDEVPDNDMTL